MNKKSIPEKVLFAYQRFLRENFTGKKVYLYKTGDYVYKISGYKEQLSEKFSLNFVNVFRKPVSGQKWRKLL